MEPSQVQADAIKIYVMCIMHIMHIICMGRGPRTRNGGTRCFGIILLLCHNSIHDLSTIGDNATVPVAPRTTTSASLRDAGAFRGAPATARATVADFGWKVSSFGLFGCGSGRWSGGA